MTIEQIMFHPPSTDCRILKLEEEIRDLTRWALLTKRQVYDAVGALSHLDGVSTEPPSAEEIALALLVSDQMHDAAKKLEAKFDDLTGDRAPEAP